MTVTFGAFFFCYSVSIFQFVCLMECGVKRLQLFRNERSEFRCILGGESQGEGLASLALGDFYRAAGDHKAAACRFGPLALGCPDGPEVCQKKVDFRIGGGELTERLNVRPDGTRPAAFIHNV